jgi:hypothetical protein
MHCPLRNYRILALDMVPPMLDTNVRLSFGFWSGQDIQGIRGIRSVQTSAIALGGSCLWGGGI